MGYAESEYFDPQFTKSAYAYNKGELVKIGGGDYTEEAIAEAEEMAKIVAGLMQGRISVRLPESGTLLSDSQVAAVGKTIELFPISIGTLAPEPEPVPVLAYCRPTAHLWSRPADSPKGTVAQCNRCNLTLTSTLKGSASEVMADLLRQIPQ